MAQHPLKQRFVLDTSVFLAPANRRDDESVDAAVSRLLDEIATAKLELNISCYVPPSIHAELTRMLEDRGVEDETLRKLDTWLVRKNPSHHEVMIPARVVYEFIDEMSDRVDRGLRVSEDAVRAAENGDEENEDGLSEADRIISELRSKYRDALRRGVLDSREDFDLLVLARELDAGVVTEDEGIVSWAEEFGLRYMHGREFPALLAEYLDATARLGERERDAWHDEREPGPE